MIYHGRSLYGHNNIVGKTNQLLSTFPDHLDFSSLPLLISTLDGIICPDHPNPRYIEIVKVRKGVFTGQNGQIKAKLETSIPVVDNKGEIFPSTAECEILTKLRSLSSSCRAYSKTL